MLLERFFPKEYLTSIYSVDYQKLKENKIKALIFDLDNTIAPYDIPEPEEKVINFFAGLRAMGFRICLLSNNSKKRVELFNQTLGLYAVHRASKPRLKAVNAALRALDASAQEAVLIGDQVFTDVWCGNRKGIYTILVEPMAQRDELSVQLKRGIEKLVVAEYLKRKG